MAATDTQVFDSRYTLLFTLVGDPNTLLGLMILCTAGQDHVAASLGSPGSFTVHSTLHLPARCPDVVPAICRALQYTLVSTYQPASHARERSSRLPFSTIREFTCQCQGCVQQPSTSMLLSEGNANPIVYPLLSLRQVR
jgi:hypothetical protein